MAMQLSKNKVKFIRRQADKMAPVQIAARLNIPLAAVAAELEKDGLAVVETHAGLIGGPCYAGFLLVLFLSPLIFSNAFYEFENVPRSLLIQAGAIVIPLLWLLRRAGNHTGAISGGPAFRPLVLLAVWALVSILWSPYQYGAVSQLVHWAACGMFYLIAFNLHADGRAIRLTLHTVMAASALIAVLGILQYLCGLDWVPQQMAPAATFNNKNMAAQIMVLTMPVSFVLAVTSSNRKLTWLYAFCTCLAALLLFYIRSRAAWLAALTETVLILGGLWFYRPDSGPGPLFDKNRKLALATSLLILFAGMQLGPGSLAPELPGAAKRTGPISDATKMGKNFDLSSGRHRVVLWKNTLAVIARHPVTGVGIRNLQVYYPTAPDKSHHRLNLHTQRAHNDYLQMYVELGLPAVFVFIWIVVLVVRAALAVGRGRDRADWIPPALICLAAMTGLGVNAFFSFPFNRALPPFLLAVYLGLFLRIAVLAASDGEPPGGREPGRKTVLFAVGVGGLLFMAWGGTAYHWAWADHYYRQHVLAFRGGDYERAVSYGRKSLEHNPGRGAVLRSLSRVYVRQKDYRNAEALFERIDRVFPHSALNLYHKAVARINQGHFEDAEKIIRRGLAVVPRSGKLQGLLGVVHQAGNEPADAVRAYRLAISLSPRVKVHHQWLGQLLYEQKRFDEAVPVLSRWIEIEPGAVAGHIKLGLIFLGREAPGTAEDHFRKALRLTPDNAALYRYLGVALTHQQKLDAAVMAFQTAVVKSRGRDAAAHNNLGSVLARQNRLAEAVVHFRSALEIDPNYQEARRNLEKVNIVLKRSQ